MPGISRSCENQCGYCFKIFILLLSCAAVGLSVAGSMQCQFLKLNMDAQRSGWDQILDAILGQTNWVWVGVFRWTPTAEDGTIEGSCQNYPEYFESVADDEAYYLYVAQICGIIAPIIGFIGVIVSMFELICCSFFGSCIFACFLFLAASGIQAGIFSMFASPNWCWTYETEEELENCYKENVDSATFWMILLSSFFFLVCSLLNCCVPRPDPCLQNQSPKDPEYASNQHHDGEIHNHDEGVEIQQVDSPGHGNHYVETY
mmetsp:Transcript_14742/g.25543  ORF Transcript_14742/g.25543 Transcript_14742/m.25543 type:complete len:260 (+) Transcript_14742:82-861(+)